MITITCLIGVVVLRVAGCVLAVQRCAGNELKKREGSHPHA